MIEGLHNIEEELISYKSKKKFTRLFFSVKCASIYYTIIILIEL